jgi:riboflavin synthase
VFTGIVRRKGRVLEVERQGTGRRFRVAVEPPVRDLGAGDSVGLNGVCFTIEELSGEGWLRVFAMEETLRRTTAGAWRRGTELNVELPLRLGDSLGGHLVQGHVDGVARVVELRRRPGSVEVELEAPAGLEGFLAEKGSVALDGVSLTVGRLSGRRFRVHLIPETLERTTLGNLRVGSQVNLEIDVIARYVARLLGDPGGKRRGKHA